MSLVHGVLGSNWRNFWPLVTIVVLSFVAFINIAIWILFYEVQILQFISSKRFSTSLFSWSNQCDSLAQPLTLFFVCLFCFCFCYCFVNAFEPIDLKFKFKLIIFSNFVPFRIWNFISTEQSDQSSNSNDDIQCKCMCYDRGRDDFQNRIDVF